MMRVLVALCVRHFGSVTALTVLALVLRVPNLGRAYWVDEGIAVGIASHARLPESWWVIRVRARIAPGRAVICAAAP